MTAHDPLTPPLDVIGVSDVMLAPDTSAPGTDTPFNGRQFIGNPSGYRWRLSMAIPASNRSLAAAWTGFVTALRGQVGTFLMGDPAGACPQGAARDAYADVDYTLLQENGSALLLESGDSLLLDAAAPPRLIVFGGGQTGNTLSLRGGVGPLTRFLAAGDYIQIGSGSAARLHKLLLDADTDSYGYLTVVVWPPVELAPPDRALVEMFNARGVFRLSDSQASWTVGSNLRYALEVNAVQAFGAVTWFLEGGLWRAEGVWSDEVDWSLSLALGPLQWFLDRGEWQPDGFWVDAVAWSTAQGPLVWFLDTGVWVLTARWVDTVAW